MDWSHNNADMRGLEARCIRVVALRQVGSGGDLEVRSVWTAAEQ
jgi:hypothetical protein